MQTYVRSGSRDEMDIQDYKAHLYEQLDFLRSSMAAYDAGKSHEAKRLSVPIRTLVHNTRSTTSLLRHLNVQERLGWIDRGPPEPPARGTVISFGLCVVRMRFDIGQSLYEPALLRPAPDRLHPPVAFEDWWGRTILRDQQGNGFSRADLVLSLANQDGGAHIDAALNEKYRQLTRENSIGFMQGENRPIANSIVHASVRHIAGELIETIESALGWNGTHATVANPICSLPLGAEVDAARNDPCPCGSGRKFKQCFGQRRPLCVMAQPQEESHAGPSPPATPESTDPDEPSSIVLDCLLLVPVGPQQRRAARQRHAA
jgi:hypothetical protein